MNLTSIIGQKLQAEYLKKKRVNPAFSLRAYAQRLGIHHTPLAEIMAGKRKVSKKMFERLALAMGLSPKMIQRYLGEQHYTPMESDQLELLSSWWVVATLEYLSLPEASRASAADIAKRLGRPSIEIKAALEVLLNLKLIQQIKEKEEDGNIKQVYQVSPEGELTSSFDHEKSDPLRKKFQKDLLELSMESIDKDPFEKRQHMGMTMAINAHKLLEARQKMREFLREMEAFLNDQNQNDEVYHFSLNLFPLTKTLSNREKS